MWLGEALNLRLNDFYWTENYFIIREQKNGRVRDRQPIPQRLLWQMEHHVETYNERIHDNNGYLFFSRHPNRKKQTFQAVDMFFHRLRQRSDWYLLNEKYGKSSDGKDLYVLTPHTLRHLYITYAVKRVGVAKAQSLARHECIESTLRYTHIDLDTKQDAIVEMYG
jgi:integrase